MDRPLDPQKRWCGPPKMFRDAWHGSQVGEEIFCNLMVDIDSEGDRMAAVRCWLKTKRKKKSKRHPTVENRLGLWSDGWYSFRLWIGEIECDPMAENSLNAWSNVQHHFWSIEGLKQWILGRSGWSKWNPTIKINSYGYTTNSKGFRTPFVIKKRWKIYL